VLVVTDDEGAAAVDSALGAVVLAVASGFGFVFAMGSASTAVGAFTAGAQLATHKGSSATGWSRESLALADSSPVADAGSDGELALLGATSTSAGSISMPRPDQTSGREAGRGSTSAGRTFTHIPAAPWSPSETRTQTATDGAEAPPNDLTAERGTLKDDTLSEP
jgi:hypothetical protein